MKPAPISPPPSLMMLLCIIGEAMRGETSVALAMPFLMIGGLVPEFGWLLKTWLRMEERAAAGQGWVGAPGDADDDFDEEHDESDGALRSGWVRQDGPVWLWRHVTRACVVIIPIRWFTPFRVAELLARGRVWCPCWRLQASAQNLFFALALATEQNHAVIVPVS